jgi:hypothetical protein
VKVAVLISLAATGGIVFGVIAMPRTHPAKSPPVARPRLDRLEDRTLPAFPIGLGTPAEEIAYDVAVDAAGNVLIAGRFESAALDFDPGPDVARLSIVGQSDLFLAKYDPAGNFLWARRIGGAGYDGAYPSVAVDPTGNAYFAGHFQGAGGISGVDRVARTEYVVRDGLASLTAQDGLVAKFGPSGGLVWVQQLQGGEGMQTYALAVEATGAAYVTGSNNALPGGGG